MSGLSWLVALIAVLAIWVDIPHHRFDFPFGCPGICIRIGDTFIEQEIKTHLGLDLQGGTQMVLQLQTDKLPPGSDTPISTLNEQARKVIDRRINSLGVSEPVIQSVGQDKILLELLAKCPKARPKELPIEFKDRKFGESKLNLKQQVLYLRHLRWLYQFRYPVLSELFQYGLVGLSGLAVDLVAFSLLFRFFLVHHLLSRAISFVVAATWNWAWNRRITFEGARSRARLPQWAAFLLVSAVGFLLNWGIYYLLTAHSAFFFSAKELALVAGVVAGFAFNYLGARLLVFGRSLVSEGAPRPEAAPEPESAPR